MASGNSARTSRRRRIGATIVAVAVIGVAGGYGTYAAFTDTTELDGTASAGTIQLNDKGSDARAFTVTGLLPGDSPSICFDVAAPAAGNTQAQTVTLVSSSTTVASTPNTSLAGDLRVSLDRAAGTGEDYLTTNGPALPATGTITMNRTSSCTLTGTPVTSITATSVTGIAGLTDSFSLAAGSKVTYKLTVALPSGAAAASQGGTASFKLLWTGSVGS